MGRGLTRSAADAADPGGDACLRRRAAALAGRYDELAAGASAAAETWKWATPSSGCAEVEPLRLQRMGRSPGRLLRHPPRGQEYEAIAYDAAGKVVCVRQHDAGGAPWLVRFFAWSDALVEIACFRAPVAAMPAALQAVTRVRLLAGQPLESRRFLPPTGASARERYHRVQGRLVRVEEDGYDRAGRPRTVVKEIAYGEDGRVSGIDRLGASGRAAVWRPGEPRAHAAHRPVHPSPARERRQACV